MDTALMLMKLVSGIEGLPVVVRVYNPEDQRDFSDIEIKSMGFEEGKYILNVDSPV